MIEKDKNQIDTPVPSVCGRICHRCRRREVLLVVLSYEPQTLLSFLGIKAAIYLRHLIILCFDLWGQSPTTIIPVAPRNINRIKVGYCVSYARRIGSRRVNPLLKNRIP